MDANSEIHIPWWLLGIQCPRCAHGCLISSNKHEEVYRCDCKGAHEYYDDVEEMTLCSGYRRRKFID